MRTRLWCSALSLLAVGCGPYLQYKSAPPAPGPSGKVIIEVRDEREPKRGGDKKEEVGVHSGTFGIPDEIRVDGPMTVTDTMTRLFGDAARAAGLAVAAKGDESGATSRVLVSVQRLWCTGYHPAYKADVTASVSILDPAGQQIRVPGQPVHAEDGGMDCKRIYKKTLTDFFNATRTLFSMPQVHDAASGANARPAPPPAN